MPRHPLGEKAMTDAERQRKRRGRLRKERGTDDRLSDRQKLAEAQKALSEAVNLSRAVDLECAASPPSPPEEGEQRTEGQAAAYAQILRGGEQQARHHDLRDIRQADEMPASRQQAERCGETGSVRAAQSMETGRGQGTTPSSLENPSNDSGIASEIVAIQRRSGAFSRNSAASRARIDWPMGMLGRAAPD